MITAKYYTPKEGGHWTPFPFSISKDAFDGYDQKILNRKITIANFDEGERKIVCSSIIFSDGTIYDCEQGKYRDKNLFPKDEVIEYMHNILDKIER